MPFVTVTIENGELVRQGLQNLSRAYPRIGRLQLYRTSLAVFRRLGVYPIKLPGQVYKRTYTARSARSVEKVKNGYLVRFDPVDRRGTHYGGYLRGSPLDASTQAKYHRSRWVPYAIILNEEVAKLPKEVVEALKIEAAKAAQETNRGSTTAR